MLNEASSKLLTNDGLNSIGNLINYANKNLLNSNSTGATRAFPKGFLDRPSSVIDDLRKSKMSKSNDSKEKLSKSKGSKSNRGGTPAPTFFKGKNKPNTALGLRDVSSQFIERSISNENITNTARFMHNTNQNKNNRKGSAKKYKGDSKFNINMQPKSLSKKAPKS